MLAEVAESLAQKMDLSEWKCSNGFLEHFKKHHNTAFKVAAEEAASIEHDAVNDWVSHLPKIIDGYSANNIFNMDESGVFYKILPEERCASQMRSVTAEREPRTA